MNYEKKTETRLIISVFIFIIGLCAFSVGLYLAITKAQHSYIMGIGYLCSTGAALIGIGAVKIFKKLSLLKDETKLKEDKIENEDERNLLLSYKASHYSLIFTAGILYIVTFIVAFINMTILYLLAGIICVLCFARIFLYTIMRKMI
jgi:uncharacterized membrane protein YiaA